MDNIAQLRHRATQALPQIARWLMPHEDLRLVQNAAMLMLYRGMIARLGKGAGSPMTGLGLDDAVALIEARSPEGRVVEEVIDEVESGCLVTIRDIGALHESLLAASLVVGEDHAPRLIHSGARKSAGVFYTPDALVSHLLDVTLRPALDRACERLRREARLEHLPCVLDAAMGSGHVLAAAASMMTSRLRALHAETGALSPLLEGEGPDETRIGDLVVHRCIFGVDVDPLAVMLARVAVGMSAGATCATCEEHLRRLDALAVGWPGEEGETWATVFPRVFERAPPGFDCVVGNPPFQSQLATDTTRAEEVTARWRRRCPETLGTYTDTAALFLLIGTHVARDDGLVSLVQPQSVLGARDARGVRTACASKASLSSLWFAAQSVFEDADVRVCAPCLHVGAEHETVQVYTGLPSRQLIEVHSDGTDAWAAPLASGMGVPAVSIQCDRVVSDHAEVTADFRDQYYDLAGLVQDNPEPTNGLAPLLTTGLVDLARCAWGETPARYAKRRWQSPVVSVDRISRETRHGEWARHRLVPKIIVATQTRAIELIVDEQGIYLPMVPLISVVPHEGVPIWALAAAIASPPVTALAARRSAGTALSTEAIKVSASQVRSFPVVTLDALDDAGASLRAASHGDDAERETHLIEMGWRTCKAFRIQSPNDLMAWWMRRLRFRST